MEKLAKLEKSDLPLWCTATFPDEYQVHAGDPKHWKKILKRFEARFRRAYPGAGLVWRLELQKRKSGRYVGEVFPHFHFLVYGLADTYAFRAWLANTWYLVCGRLSPQHLAAGTSCVRVDNSRHLNSYISKYMAKVADTGLEVGRVWGVWNEQNLPWVKALFVQLSEAEAVKLMRYMRRFANLRGHDYKALSIFCDADFWYRRLSDILYPP